MRSQKFLFYYFQSIVPLHFCDDIVKFAASKNSKEGDIFGTDQSMANFTVFKKRNKKKLQKTRNSKITWLDELWIHLELENIIEQANRRADWQLQWDRREAAQFTEYALNQHYDWHNDAWIEPYSKEGPLRGSNRKLSMTLNLSDSKDYKGGELEFMNITNNGKVKKWKCTEILPKGSVCVFPSTIWHRVTPVTKGKRLSLVKWVSGNPLH